MSQQRPLKTQPDPLPSPPTGGLLREPGEPFYVPINHFGNKENLIQMNHIENVIEICIYFFMHLCILLSVQIQICSFPLTIHLMLNAIIIYNEIQFMTFDNS